MKPDKTPPDRPGTPRSARVITLLAMFRTATRLMVDELVARLHAAGYDDITPAQHLVFENIDPQGTRLTTLGQRAGITRQSVTELAEVLARNGYVEIQPDPTDRRARLVVLTPAGRTLVRQAIKEIAAIESAWETHFQRAGLDDDLKRVVAAALAERGVTEADAP